MNEAEELHMAGDRVSLGLYLFAHPFSTFVSMETQFAIKFKSQGNVKF